MHTITRHEAARVIRAARAKIGGGMESSARLALADAVALFDSGDWEHAYNRASKSLQYSCGVNGANKRDTRGGIIG